MIFQHCWVCHISIAGGVNQFVNSFFYVWEVKSERGEVERLLQSEGKWVKLMGLFQSKWSFLISLTLEFMQPDIRFIAIYVFQVLAKYIFFFIMTKCRVFCLCNLFHVLCAKIWKLQFIIYIIWTKLTKSFVYFYYVPSGVASIEAMRQLPHYVFFCKKKFNVINIIKVD